MPNPLTLGEQRKKILARPGEEPTRRGMRVAAAETAFVYSIGRGRPLRRLPESALTQ